ncbi:MAG: hypothetical protein SFX73_16190 [Kofleriaceae bacterium]|nr:hypothetical protein [Kofleriaceae bacterium]
MSTLDPFTSTKDDIAAALESSGYELVHGSLEQLPEPYYLIHGPSTLSGIPLTSGTLVVEGDLTVTGPIDFHQTGRPIVNLIVTGNCTLGLAYVDAFLCVGKNLTVGTLIADSNWSGGVFVGGDLVGHTLVSKDIGVEVDGRQHVEIVADCDDLDAARVAVPALFEGDGEDPHPRELFIALRDSSDPLVPAHPAKTPAAKAAASVAKKPVARKPAAKKAATKKPAAKKAATKKPAAKKAATKKPAAKKAATKKPAAKKAATKKPAAKKAAAKKPAKSKRR